MQYFKKITLFVLGLIIIPNALTMIDELLFIHDDDISMRGYFITSYLLIYLFTPVLQSLIKKPINKYLIYAVLYLISFVLGFFLYYEIV